MPTRFTTSAQTVTVEELCDFSLVDVVDYVHKPRVYYKHPVTSIYVCMTSATGGDPFICPDCDYKTTINELFLDHRELDH